MGETGILTETRKNIAQRSEVKDQDGNIIDINFTQGENIVSLKTVLPGTYKIVFTHHPVEEMKYRDKATYSAKHDVIEVNLPSFAEEEVNIAILHEAGHAADEYKHHDQNYARHLQLLEAATKFFIAREHVQSPHNSLNVYQQTLNAYDDLRSSYPDETIDEILDNIEMYYSELQKHQGDTYQPMVDTEIAQRNIKAESLVNEERNAWAYALVALREMNKKGVTLFNGKSSELLTYVKTKLGTYEKEYSGNLSPGKSFVRRQN